MTSKDNFGPHATAGCGVARICERKPLEIETVPNHQGKATNYVRLGD